MVWRELDKGVRNYLWLYSISGFSFSAVIAVPSFGKLMNISIENVGWLFSFSYIVQAVLTYVLGKKFEQFSTNYGLFLAKISFALGSLLFALCNGLWLFAIAQMLLSFTDVFYPCQVMYERALFPPKYRETLYSYLFFATESTKAISYALFVFVLSPFMGGKTFLKAVFVMIFLLNFFYAFSYLKILPKIQSGLVLHKGQVIATTNFRAFFSIMLHQYLSYVAFNFSGFLVISYYLIDYFKLSSSSPFLFEMVFSASVALSWFWRKRIRTKAHINLMIGNFLILSTFLLWVIPNVYVFFISHILMGIGFILWFPAKETIKIQIAPRELGRWEGFFQGLNIFSRIFTPVLSAYVAMALGYQQVFLISSIFSAFALLASLPAATWIRKFAYQSKVD
ncbi:MFS transporter [Pseudothermotoga sp.]|uniref:MFS transporter n=1 Tax=Pseudothermotoga sp. TaxID=2033661 RepID=UPI00258EDBDC|nr:MFS transporter [Pseudothermotoga sp.]MDK2883828.1 hypothetical protein [Pseudothermotoga sp.]